MCIFEEKLDEATLEKVQDFEFAVSWNTVEYLVTGMHLHKKK